MHRQVISRFWFHRHELSAFSCLLYAQFGEQHTPITCTDSLTSLILKSGGFPIWKTSYLKVKITILPIVNGILDQSTRTIPLVWFYPREVLEVSCKIAKEFNLPTLFVDDNLSNHHLQWASLLSTSESNRESPRRFTQRDSKNSLGRSKICGWMGSF